MKTILETPAETTEIGKMGVEWLPVPRSGNITLALTPKEAARALGLKEATLADWRRTNYGPAFVRLGKLNGRILYKVSDLEAFLDARRVETDPNARRRPKAEHKAPSGETTSR